MQPAAHGGADIEREWSGPFLRARVINRTQAPIHLHDVVVHEESLALPPATALYGEGFQMLTQTAGTLAAPLI